MAVKRAMDASRRRLVFGFNVIVQALLAVVLVVGVIWLAGRFELRADLTRTGVNSLSPRTVQMLRHLDQDVRITAVFPRPDKERDPLGQKRYREIQDLLDLYDASGGARVSTYLVDPTVEQAKVDELLARLRDLPAYADEAQPHKKALEAFPPLNKQISALAASEYQRLEELAGAGQQMAQDRNINQVTGYLRAVVQSADRTTERLQDLVAGEIPRYGPAVREVRDYLTEIREILNAVFRWMKTDALSIAGITPELRTFFQEAPSRYEKLLADIDGLLESTQDLEDVKLEEIYSQLTRWRSGPPVLVSTDTEARVVPFWELWKPSSNPQAPVGPDGETREFAGEAAISSAILQLTQKEKTAVIFTRFGGPSPIRPDFSQMNAMTRQMPTAPYQTLNELLEKANFVTEDWDLAQAKTPPVVEDAVRTIYVVFPPEPPPQPNPMQPSPQAGMTDEDRQIVIDAIGKSGMAVFLAGYPPPTPAASPMLPPAPGTYEYADYLRSKWGVDVEYDHLVFSCMPNQQKPGWWVPAGREPRMISGDVIELTNHAIARPSQTDRAAMFLVSPLEPVEGEDKPAGVTVEVVARVRPTEDVWAVKDLYRLETQWKENQGLRPDPEDLAAPFPIAVTSTNADGQKVVVFGSEQFASDAIAQATALQMVGNHLVLGVLYPANSDLFINALHWLSGEAERISVGPRRGEAPRLKDLDAKWAGRLPWFLVGIWPAAVLVVGLGVWLVRRR